MVASFLVATSVFGQEVQPSKASPAIKNEMQGGAKSCAKPECKPKACPPPCPQPCPPTQMCPQPPATCCPPWPVPVLNAAYNYPARTQTRCPWDIAFDASFILWQPLEDNLEFAMVNNIPANPNTANVPAGVINANVVDMDFNYKPGFKVGFTGYFEYDNWDTHIEYTWFHTKNSNSTSVPAIAASAQVIYPMMGHPASLFAAGAGTNNGAFVFNSASEHWKMHMDIIDWDLGRWYYVGTKLTFRPNFGARAAFIRQRLDVDYSSDTPFSSLDNTANAQTVPAFRAVDIAAKSGSWGVGLKTGLDANWMIGQGFRVFGCGEADILFTRYTSLGFSQRVTPLLPSNLAPVSSIVVNQGKHNTVRTHLDLQMGFGWGTYWDCNNWYTDFMLGYEFQVFFDQNMFRHFESSVMQGLSRDTNGNLYAQGLTAEFSLTF